MSSSDWDVESMPDQSGRTVVVTGANSGLGYEATRAFARAGARVVMACRSLDRGERAAYDRLIAESVETIVGEQPLFRYHVRQAPVLDESGALVGAGLGFLWFNTYPAQVFMGDVGALALGAALGTVAVITRHEIVFFIMGGIFVLETVSVILQVASFKLTGRRMFRMAPIHHHFELKGWPEPRVIVRFWIITVMLVLFGLATLKLR